MSVGNAFESCKLVIEAETANDVLLSLEIAFRLYDRPQRVLSDSQLL